MPNPNVGDQVVYKLNFGINAGQARPATVTAVDVAGVADLVVFTRGVFDELAPAFLQRVVSQGSGNGQYALSGGAGTLPVAGGGTGVTAIPVNAIPIGQGTSPVTFLTPNIGSRLVRSDGTQYSNSQAVLTSDVVGVLPVANGGTGASNLAAGVLMGGGTAPVSSQATLPVGNGGTGSNVALTNGHVMVSNAGAIVDASPAAVLILLGIRPGSTTLVAGTKLVPDTATTAGTKISLTPSAPVPGAGNLTVTYSHVSNTAGVGFTVRANLADGTINTADTSTLDYLAIA